MTTPSTGPAANPASKPPHNQQYKQMLITTWHALIHLHGAFLQQFLDAVVEKNLIQKNLLTPHFFEEQIKPKSHVLPSCLSTHLNMAL